MFVSAIRSSVSVMAVLSVKSESILLMVRVLEEVRKRKSIICRQEDFICSVDEYV